MSLPASAAQLCEWTGGHLLRGRPNQSFEGTKIDSREVGSRDLFVAIIGPNHDAHRFLGDVLLGGAAGAMVQSDRIDHSLPRSDGFIVQVEDTTRALADLARGHRGSFDGPLIGITGSNGKTTTKELCADILSGVGSTLSTRGNLNNNFGVPLTLLRREDGDGFAVIEMGMNHRGEIADLAAIAQPSIGVLTNIGSAHIEFLGSRETIAEEKGDLLAALPTEGTAVVGHDDPLALAQSERSDARVLSFGRDPKADLCASSIRFLGEGAYAFELESPFGRGEIRVPGLAETIVENALAAAGGALAAGASFERVASGLASHGGVPGRMQPRSFPNDVLIIDDAYNANPQSMRAALETLARLESGGRRLAVLGQMGELGDAAEAEHLGIGRLIGSLDLHEVFLLGPFADLVAEGAHESGLTKNRIHIEKDHASLARTLKMRLGKGDRVLVKGSRAAHMEGVIELLAEGDR
ncbi:MAG: UDP-N-acetylmuramoyl-tripeptide--D-alanyl-D-alanine ligase [bacterium]|nr:UDP-N-acetylmuramoylalanyl-D-glutamyl-2, 6-diaminopimelate--D-alanyl-D-alanine ligase [Deltaproteobacteria bacterium]MCP4907227.1 UDP-N-acetylmuramoyl-tripeptide--D-alanyl-D-alanine ligase [bacterium]